MKKGSIYFLRVILFGWLMFGLGVFASGKFGGKMARIYFGIRSAVNWI